jgi:hypothetical protein
LVVAAARRDNAPLVQQMAAWTAAVAGARGWTSLALLAGAYSPSRNEPASGVQPRLITNPDGSTTIVMPVPAGRPSGIDPGRPLPDDFGD